jgi:hypothetical protein
MRKDEAAIEREIKDKGLTANARDKIWPLLGFRLRDELAS